MRSKFDHKLLWDHFHKSLPAMSLFWLLAFGCCCCCCCHWLMILLVNEYKHYFVMNTYKSEKLWNWWNIVWQQKKKEQKTNKKVCVRKQNHILLSDPMFVSMCVKSDKDKYLLNWKWFHSMAKLYKAWKLWK